MRKTFILFFIMILIVIISACSSNDNEDSNETGQDMNEETSEDKADDITEEEMTVVLNDVDGNEIAEASLTQVDEGVKIKLSGDGLPKEQAKHGFHIHEKGICEPGDFESAGGHYNPTDKNHGKEHEEGHHAGDFDNIEVTADGEIVDNEFTTDQISLDENAENTVFSDDGTALVIHAGPDDYKSQPSGDAGDRIACGVIAEPK